ncbi:ketoacyl-ACP synthase III [Bombilactobacillus folatiphilus]|uniref:Beta-ketoacyl-[acyl-carrier-protein] synthase III n=1 Tax=Bombilactobacillus folatiphilus TaxID=2923362 RepID=A0ABY4P8R8_9LACO|nr:beta-ketoacyl-ACP synthase III [Bombilactobacillus folatiphilus]UQS82058.1 ketoacyl-ACP synthase III [Bombilactobacillus folatiphilus]
MGLRIQQTSYYVPPKIVTNDDLTQLMETSDEWITSRTGIKQRHLSENEQTSDLAYQVAKQLLAQANVEAKSVDFIIVATMSPDYQTPSTAALVQGRLGASQAFAFDISAACSGFIYALALADKLLQGSYQRGLVIGAETLSKLIDWQARSTAVLFGDGAGGVLVEAAPQVPGIVAEDLQTLGDQFQALTAGYLPLNSAFTKDSTEAKQHYFQMDGHAVYRFATHVVPDSVQKVVKQAQWSLADVDHFLLHQANGRMLKVIAQHLDQPLDKFLQNVAEFGNTSAASVPILLAQSVAQGLITRQQKLVLSGFGGGLTAGSLALIY